MTCIAVLGCMQGALIPLIKLDYSLCECYNGFLISVLKILYILKQIKQVNSLMFTYTVMQIVVCIFPHSSLHFNCLYSNAARQVHTN